MNGPIRRVALTVFVLFGVLLSAVTYFQVIKGPNYRDDPRNVRVLAGRTGRERGTIITADGVVVAQSEANPEDPRVFRRSYPEGALYGHAVGYSTLLFGDTAVERALADQLVSDRDSTISGVINALLGEGLRPEGLRLTIDHGLQAAAADALGDERGAIVAIDPATGAILALVSKPDFDPNTLLGTTAAPAGDSLAAAEDMPLLNRALSQTYPPGSTFKIITAAAALETGAAGPGTAYPNPVELTLPGSTATIRNFDRQRCGSAAEITLTEAFATSCNTTFGQIGLELSPGDLIDAAEAFGFDFDVPFILETVRSVIPSAESFANDAPALAQSAIGQRDVRATPLEMALVAAGIANGGLIMSPYIVAEVFNANGEITETTEPEAWRRATSPSTADVLADLMERVVTSGTGSRAAVAGVRIAGKTGTAEVPDGDPHVWFVGFGPVGARPGTPQIAIAVLIESGGDLGENATGGSVAAPVAQRVLAAFFEQ